VQAKGDEGSSLYEHQRSAIGPGVGRRPIPLDFITMPAPFSRALVVEQPQSTRVEGAGIVMQSLAAMSGVIMKRYICRNSVRGFRPFPFL